MKNVTDIYPDRVEKREATPDELAARQEVLDSLAIKEAKDISDAATKAATLAKLGLTAEELAAILA